MTDEHSQTSKTWISRIKDSVITFFVDKTLSWVLGILLASTLGAGGYFSFEYWENTSKEPAKVAKEATQRSSSDTSIPKGNLGYKRVSSYMVSSKLEHFTDGANKAPFFELQKGFHDVNFSVKGKTVEGGYVFGIRGTPHYWKVSGNFNADFTTDSLYALIADGQENFLEESILPVIRDKVEASLTEAVEQQEVEAEVSDPSKQGSSSERLTKLVAENVSVELSKEFGLQNVSISFDSIEELDQAQLKRENLESLEHISSDTLVHFVGQPKTVAVGGPIGFVATVFFVMAFVIFLFFLKLALPF